MLYEVITITVTGKMAVVESNHINVSCNGLSTGLLSVDVTGGPADRLFTYNWQRETAPATWVNVAAPLVNGSATINALPSGTYRVIVTSTSSGCSVTSPSYVITQTPALTISSVNAPPITTCNGDNSGFIELSVTGGSGVYYLDYNEDNVTDFTSSTGLFRVNNLVAGSYKLSVSDHALCTAPIQNVSITQPNALAFRITSYNVCYTKLLRITVIAALFLCFFAPAMMAHAGEDSMPRTWFSDRNVRGRTMNRFVHSLVPRIQ